MAQQQTVDLIVDPSHPVNYASSETPPNYRCRSCGASGCKLWRDYQTMLENQTLLCALCAGKEQGKNVSDIDVHGRRSSDGSSSRRTDQIGWRVPAVPTEANVTYWGYTSVPEAGCQWWRRLPSLPAKV